MMSDDQVAAVVNYVRTHFGNTTAMPWSLRTSRTRDRDSEQMQRVRCDEARGG